MRPHVRPAPAAIVAEAAPECVNPPEGYESLPPLLRGLMGANERRWHGSVIVRDAAGCARGSLRCRAGQVIAGRVNGGSDLLEAVAGLCSNRELRDIDFISDEDLVEDGSDVTYGSLDALQLVAAVLRNSQALECVTAAVQFIGARSLILRGKPALERYRFTVSERSVIEILHGAPQTLAELGREAILPREAVERIVCTLWLTRAITLAPTWLRTISRAVDQPTISLAPPRSDRDDPTLVVPIRTAPLGTYSDRPPAHEASEPSQISPRGSQYPLPSAASAQERADQHFEVAEVLLARGYPREAVLEAQKGMRLCRPSPAQEALYAWALYQRAGAGRTVPLHVWEHLENALNADPSCELARRFWALLERGDDRTREP